MATACPKCTRIRNTRDERTVGWCSKCERFQYLFQSEFQDFADAVHRHLACVACRDGAWCRDLRIKPSAVECAHRAHRHGFDVEHD